MNKIQHLFVAFVNVNSVKFAYSAGIEHQIYIHFAKTHLFIYYIYSGYGKYSDPLKFFTLCYIC